MSQSGLSLYVSRALEGECRKVETAPPGQSNATLHKASVALGTIVPSGELTRDEAERHLMSAARKRGKDAHEAGATINSGLNWGEQHPRSIERRETPSGNSSRARNTSFEALWSLGLPAQGTTVETYWRARGLRGTVPDAIRFSASVRMPGGDVSPALLAAVTVPTTGHLIAVQRTALAADGSGKAPIGTPKASLGKTAGGAVVLGSLVGAGTVLEGEGIETVASSCEATGLPGIATLSAGTLGKPQLPDGVAAIILGDLGSEEAAEAGARRRQSEGRDVKIAYPPAGGGKDFNDLLRSHGADAVRAAIDTATVLPPAEVVKPYQSRCLTDIEARPVHWLWENRLGKGKLSLIAGHPGRGKSQLTLFMAALVSTGGDWPDGAVCERGSVVLITCEDEAADTIKPRLMALGADMTRCHILDGARDGSGKLVPFSIKRGAESLAALANDLEDLALIIIDPVSAYLDGLDSHNNAEVRSGLLPLQDIAERTGAAVLLVSHFNKGTADGTALSRISGSGAFAAVCRSAWVVERDPDDTEGKRRILAPMKNNIGDDQTGFRFNLEGVEVGGGIASSRVRFLPGEVRISADVLVRSVGTAERAPSQLQKAAEFLAEQLREGPLTQAELMARAKAGGHKERTLVRAKKEVGVISRRLGDGWIWSLPLEDQPSQECQGCQRAESRPSGDLHLETSDQSQRCQSKVSEFHGNVGSLGTLGCGEAAKV